MRYSKRSKSRNKNPFKKISSGKKSQVTIFIIIAITIVLAILFIFFFRRPITVDIVDKANPASYIESCTEDAVKSSINILEEQGGDIQLKNSVMYNDTNISYLCYTPRYYEQCMNQRPLLIEHAQQEMKKYLEPKIQMCFNNMRSAFEKRYDVEVDEPLGLEINLISKQVNIKISKHVAITKENKGSSYDDFYYEVASPIYNILKIAMEISNQESQYCSFDTLGYMLLYPDYDISKFKTGDSDTIYMIKEKNTDETFKFAVRSCVMPPGI